MNFTFRGTDYSSNNDHLTLQEIGIFRTLKPVLFQKYFPVKVAISNQKKTPLMNVQIGWFKSGELTARILRSMLKINSNESWTLKDKPRLGRDGNVYPNALLTLARFEKMSDYQEVQYIINLPEDLCYTFRIDQRKITFNEENLDLSPLDLL